MPGRFHQEPADQAVARARDPAAAMFLTAGVLAGYQSEIGHQRAGRLEATKVVQLRQDQDGREGVDARKQRNHATGSRYGSACAMAVRRTSSSVSRAST